MFPSHSTASARAAASALARAPSKPPLPEDFLDRPKWPRFIVAVLSLLREFEPELTTSANKDRRTAAIFYEIAVATYPSFDLLAGWSRPLYQRGSSSLAHDWCPVLQPGDTLLIIRGATRLVELQATFDTLSFFNRASDPAFDLPYHTFFLHEPCETHPFALIPTGNGLVEFEQPNPHAYMGDKPIKLRRQLRSLAQAYEDRLGSYRTEGGPCTICVMDVGDKLRALDRYFKENDLKIFTDPRLKSFTILYHLEAAAAEQRRVEEGYYDDYPVEGGWGQAGDDEDDFY